MRLRESISTPTNFSRKIVTGHSRRAVSSRTGSSFFAGLDHLLIRTSSENTRMGTSDLENEGVNEPHLSRKTLKVELVWQWKWRLLLLRMADSKDLLSWGTQADLDCGNREWYGALLCYDICVVCILAIVCYCYGGKVRSEKAPSWILYILLDSVFSWRPERSRGLTSISIYDSGGTEWEGVRLVCSIIPCGWRRA